MEETEEFTAYKEKWYLQTWLIVVLFLGWSLIIPPIIGFILLGGQYVERKKYDDKLAEKYKQLQEKNSTLLKYQSIYEETKANRYEDITKLVEEKTIELKQFEQQKEDILHLIDDYNMQIEQKNVELLSKDNELEKKEKQLQSSIKKLSRTKELYKSLDYCISKFFAYEPNDTVLKVDANTLGEIEDFSPNVILQLHSMDIKDLKKAFSENDKNISKILETYSSRYTTKANQAIYKLMVIALRAELQNILYSLKYEKLDKSMDEIKEITSKYLSIAGSGNQSILSTLTKFIGEIEYLFINAAKIEYNYYVKKEQARQEQIALREQMRQEAAERKELQKERQRIENEEKKFNQELNKLNEQISTSSDNAEIEQLKARVLELQSQLSDVIIKKDEIASLENGKAGTVYIISNLGSFGENVFKIGMTRRLNPQERVDELGSASVPFKFDVHSFIFSKDAVLLESKMHEMLNKQRVNKVNRRKEFFRITIDELEELVNKIEPTAEFNKTMIAEEFRNSQLSDL